MKIIDANASFLDQIVEIEKQSFTCPWSRGIFETALDAINSKVYALVDDDNTVIGYSCLLIIDYEAEILNIAVGENFRKKGYGKQLLEHLLNECRKLEIDDVFLEVRESNISARALYDSSGFEAIGRRKNYYVLPREDAILMRISLSTDSI